MFIAGGEPLVRDDIAEIITFAGYKSVKTSLVSNGYLLNEQMAEQLLLAGLSVINISVDGMHARTHDYSRGVKGSYKKAMNAINNISYMMKKHDRYIYMQLSTILNGLNANEIPDLLKWVKNKESVQDILLQVLSAPFFSGSYKKDWYKNNPLWPDNIDEICEIIICLKDMKNNNYPLVNSFAHLDLFKKYFKKPDLKVRPEKCTVGNTVFDIDNNGNVRICRSMEPVGNILEEDPESIWLGKMAQSVRKKISNCKRNCDLLLCNVSL